MQPPKISLGSWVFSFGPFEANPWSFDRFIRYAAEAGYDGIEINGFRPHPHPEDYATPAKCRELKAQISGLGLGISGYAPAFGEVPPGEVETPVYLAEIQKCLLFCNRLEINHLRVDSVSAPKALPPGEYEQRFGHLALTWRKAAELCRQAGVLLVWEFEPGFWLNKPSEVKRLVEAVDHPNFKLLFDTSHAYMGSVMSSRHTGMPERLRGGVVEYARLLRPYLGHLHLIDSDGSLHDNATSTHYPFGKGNVDFVGALSALRPELDQLEWWCVDYCFWPDSETDAQKAVPFVRNLANEVYKEKTESKDKL